MPRHLLRVAAIAILAIVCATASAEQVVVVNRPPASAPQSRGMTREQRGEKLGMGLGILIGGVVVVGYWILKSGRDD